MVFDLFKPRYFLYPLLLCLTAASSIAASAQLPCAQQVSVDCGKTPTATWFDGRLWVAFVQEKTLYVAHSDGWQAPFSTPVAVNDAPEAIETNGENRPKIALTDKAILVSWTQKTEGHYTGDIRFSRSLDNGKTFETPRTVNDDGLLISHRFDSLLAYPSGTVYLTWLDKRNKVKQKKSKSGSAVFFAVSTDHGKTFSENQVVADNSCECCRIAVAPTSDSGLAIFWRNIYENSIRDHGFAQLSAEEITTGPVRATFDDWQIEACPHHGPDMAVAGKNTYHLAWFSNGSNHKGILYGLFDQSQGKTRQIAVMDTSAGASHPQVAHSGKAVYFAWKLFDGEHTVIRLAVSNDGGQSWSEPYTLALTEGPSDHPQFISAKSQIYLTWHTQNEGFRVINADVSTSTTNE